MKKDSTELVCILDRSGSMAGLESDTIGGFNAMLKKQAALEGECRVTTILFDHHVSTLHDRIDIRGIAPLTEKEYFVGGCTALYDAVGIGIDRIAKAQKNTAEDYRAEHVIFLITTDGMENASRHYSGKKVRKMIDKMKKKYGWEFIFSGANIDAAETADEMGIGCANSIQFDATPVGVACMFDAACRDMTRRRVSRKK